jgi:hypothetical protein
VIDRDAYCRELEAHLCRKNDGHLIRIVGPAFERVMSWAEQGIPVKVAEAGIDRYFERYYRKGPRRRPVRIEFCEADVLDAFDEWRRAVGVTVVAPDAEGGPPVVDPDEAARPRRGLSTHIQGVVARLTVLRGSDKLRGTADAALEAAVGQLESLAAGTRRVRGEEREAAIQALQEIDAVLIDRLAKSMDEPDRQALRAEAARELEPFRDRMPADAYEQAIEAAFARLVRQRFGIPTMAF